MDRPMGQEGSQEAAGPGPGSQAQGRPTGFFRSLMPARWRRLQAQVEGDAYTLPSNGAQYTLVDLMREAQRHAEESGAGESNMVDTDLEEPYEPGRKVTGWLGTPDPSKYGAGTNQLTKEQVQEEMDAGNIVCMEDWIKGLAEQEPWQQELFKQVVAADYKQNRMFVDVGESGQEPAGKVSLLDLENYVHHNPELKALVERQRNFAAYGESNPGQLPEEMLPFVGLPGNTRKMVLPPATMDKLPWALVGEGCVWRRRPTRWLKGLDGQLDFRFGVYVHEGHAHTLLGPTWAGHPTREATGSPQFWEDVLAAGPQLGMTFAIAAARDVPLQEAAQCWHQHIKQRLHVRGTAEDQVQDSLDSLGGLMDVPRMLAETRLFNPRGSHIREGSTLLLTLMPDGGLLAQGMTGDPLRTREYYIMGSLERAQPLCAALVSLALGGGPGKQQEPPLDEDILWRAGPNILNAAKGIKAGRLNEMPSMHGVVNPLIPGRMVAFKLRPVGDVPGAAVPVVLHGILEQRSAIQLHSVFEAAAQAAFTAASQLPADTSFEKVLEARTAAAQQVLSSGLAALGVPDILLQGHDSGQQGQAGQGEAEGLFSLAVPLEGQDTPLPGQT